MSQTKKQKQSTSAQPVDHVKALASTLEDILKARGVAIGHRNALHAVSALAGHPNFHALLNTLKSLGVSVGHLNALHAVTALAEHPSYKALQARGSQEPTPAPAMTLTLSRFTASLRQREASTTTVTIPPEGLQDILDHAVQIGLAVEHGHSPLRFTDELHNALETYGVLQACYEAPEAGSLASPEAILAFLETFGLEILEDSDQPGCYCWQAPTDVSEVSFPTRADAIADAWSTVEFYTMQATGTSLDAWEQMDDTRKRELIAEYFASES